MKKLALCELENILELSADYITTLVVENPPKLYEYVRALIAQCDGEDGGFVLSENLEPLDFEKNCVMIHNFFDLDVNSKTIVSLLNKKIAALRAKPEFAMKTGEVYSLLMNLVKAAEFEFSIPLECYAEADLQTLFKACGVRVADGQKTLADKLALYVGIICELKKFSVLILCQPHEFLSAAEVSGLHAHCRLLGISILAVEGKTPPQMSAEEKRLIIDGDLCEIFVEAK